MVNEAMRATDVTQFAQRSVDELSGGERQRVWLAMVLAQQTSTLLLDEPTTFLDLAHQIDVLELCASVKHHRSMTVVVVMHELNLAIRYADHLIVMKDGRIQAVGAPGDIVTEELIQKTFSLPCRILEDPETGKPLVIPRLRTPCPPRWPNRLGNSPPRVHLRPSIVGARTGYRPDVRRPGDLECMSEQRRTRVRTPMRIGLIASSRFPVPEPFTGGLEAHTHALASALHASRTRGQRVRRAGSDPALGVTPLSRARSRAARPRAPT